jgi:nickel-type superoxide dismutase maturation protease
MFPFRRFRVEDESMRPTLEPGDYVLVNRWAYHFQSPKRGDVVVVQDPEAPERFLVKRVSDTTNPSQVQLAGDNERLSRDSRAFGPVRIERIVGKVWIRLKR